MKPTTDTNGTCLQGYLGITYDELTAAFGEPHSDGDGYKVDAKWDFVTDDGVVFSIYNYKDGKNYNGEDGTPVEQITNWRIGGHDQRAVTAAVDYLLRLHAPKLELKE